MHEEWGRPAKEGILCEMLAYLQKIEGTVLEVHAAAA
jgi:hypothetical protein